MTTRTHLNVTVINTDKGWIYGEWREDITDDDMTRGELYRACQREYGRCTGKVYIDTASGTLAIGWVFVSREEYEDSRETYLRETWISISAETVSTSYPEWS